MSPAVVLAVTCIGDAYGARPRFKDVGKLLLQFLDLCLAGIDLLLTQRRNSPRCFCGSSSIGGCGVTEKTLMLLNPSIKDVVNIEVSCGGLQDGLGRRTGKNNRQSRTSLAHPREVLSGYHLVVCDFPNYRPYVAEERGKSMSF